MVITFSHLSDSVGIPENDTNLGGSQTLLGELEDLLRHLVARHLHPSRHRAPVRQGRLGDTLSRCVHTTHF